VVLVAGVAVGVVVGVVVVVGGVVGVVVDVVVGVVVGVVVVGARVVVGVVGVVFVVVVGVVAVFVVVVGVVVAFVVVIVVVGVVVGVGAVVGVVWKIPWQFRSARSPTVCTPCSRLLTSVWLTDPSFSIETCRAAIAVSTSPHCRLLTAADTCSSPVLRLAAWPVVSSPPLLAHPTSAETAKPRPPATIALFAKRIG
jgi:hypothetical protein